MEHLPSLEDLIIEGCPALASLPDNMKCLTALRRLTIKQCPKLSNLPDVLKDISTLQYLFISGCGKLEEEWFKMAHVSCVVVRGEMPREEEHRRQLLAST